MDIHSKFIAVRPAPTAGKERTHSAIVFIIILIAVANVQRRRERFPGRLINVIVILVRMSDSVSSKSELVFVFI